MNLFKKITVGIIMVLAAVALVGCDEAMPAKPKKETPKEQPVKPASVPQETPEPEWKILGEVPNWGTWKTTTGPVHRELKFVEDKVVLRTVGDEVEEVLWEGEVVFGVERGENYTVYVYASEAAFDNDSRLSLGGLPSRHESKVVFELSGDFFVEAQQYKEELGRKALSYDGSDYSGEVCRQEEWRPNDPNDSGKGKKLWTSKDFSVDNC